MVHAATAMSRISKNDLKRKRINRGYKRGGKFRSINFSEESENNINEVKKKGRSKKNK